MADEKKEVRAKLTAEDIEVTADGQVRIKSEDVSARLRELIKEAKNKPDASTVPVGIRVDA